MIPFNLPIFYNKDKRELKEHVIADLELVEPIESGPCMYDFVIGSAAKESAFSRNLIPQVAQYYTTNTAFLKQTQTLIKNFSPPQSSEDEKVNANNTVDQYNDIHAIWNSIQNDKHFKDKFGYIDIGLLEPLNSSSFFLQILSLQNLASPVISLLTPLIILIIPFFLLKIQIV